MSIFLTSIFLTLIAMLGNGEYFLGSSMLSRPLITCTLTGLAMGDIKQGIIIGASLELAFVGSFSIGASIPPEIISGSVLGTAFAIQKSLANPAINQQEIVGLALTLGIPIASLVLVVKNLCFIFILPNFVHKADQYAEEGDGRKMGMMNILGGFFSINLPIGLVVFCSYMFGSNAMKALLDFIPKFITNGLQVATGLLPAFGFAMLMKIMINKKNAPFFILGFALAVYMKVPVTGVAIFGACLALILTGYSAFHDKTVPVANANNDSSEGGIDYEDEEF